MSSEPEDVMAGEVPIFLQVAEQLAASVVDGSLPEEAQVPSTTELALFHLINPATAAKGVQQLVADGVLYKRRGIGMFVRTGARDRLRERRRQQFARQFVEPLAREAHRLGLSADDLRSMIETVDARP